MENVGLQVSKMWLDILKKASTKQDMENYPEVIKHSTIEMQVIIMTSTTPNMLLRNYVETLNIAKSSLTSIVDRLEKQQILKRVISTKDKRSYGLKLCKKGVGLCESYNQYQNDIGNRIVKALNEDERNKLITILNKISTSIKE